jgi:hypothetical protein
MVSHSKIFVVSLDDFLAEFSSEIYLPFDNLGLLASAMFEHQHSRLCLVLKETNESLETAVTVTVTEDSLLLEACTYTMRLCGLLCFPSLSLCVSRTDASRVQLPIKRCSEP